MATGRKARGPRAADLLPLYTRNTDDFRGIEHLVEVVGV